MQNFVCPCCGQNVPVPLLPAATKALIDYADFLDIRGRIDAELGVNFEVTPIFDICVPVDEITKFGEKFLSDKGVSQ